MRTNDVPQLLERHARCLPPPRSPREPTYPGSGLMTIQIVPGLIG
jgi:hypothetical protein